MDWEFLSSLFNPMAAGQTLGGQLGAGAAAILPSVVPPALPPPVVDMGVGVNDYQGAGSSLGAALNPTVPLPPPRPTPTALGGPFGGSPETNPNLRPVSSTGKADVGSALTNALRGVVATRPPAPQTVHTPTAPHPTAAIRSGELMRLLEMLNASSAQGGGGLHLPNSLGQALRA